MQTQNYEEKSQNIGMQTQNYEKSQNIGMKTQTYEKKKAKDRDENSEL